ncbi:MAG: DHH family phosphoesterase [Clostridia bacterium]|nr:DHH family phosphoesterase [Clostridia bacterium]
MNNKFIRKINLLTVNSVLLFTVLVVCSYLMILSERYVAALILGIIAVVCAALNIIVHWIKQRERLKRIKLLTFYAEGNIHPGPGAIPFFRLPLVFLSAEGKFLWCNDLFRGIFRDQSDLQKVLRELYIVHLRGKLENQTLMLETPVEFSDRNFLMMTNIVRLDQEHQEDNFAIMLYFSENTEYVLLKEKYESRQTAVAEIAVDSYQEIFQSNGEAVINAITVELSKIFTKWLSGTNAVIKKLVQDRYILILEEAALKRLEQEKFSVLNQVKRISVGNRIPVTLSIGVGIHGDSVQANYEAASEALELALSRGGDQAVVRDQNHDDYYGGSTMDMETLSKVKSRIVADLLKKEIQRSSRVLIMGHQIGDMDSLGASLCVYRACAFFGIEAKIILNEGNPAINGMLKRLQAIPEYADLFINTSYALNLVDDDTLAVVVDTSRQNMTECPKLLDYVPRVAVVDHHRKAADYLKETVLDYSESYASSTSELLVEVLQYMIPHVAVPVVEAEAMYAGMLVDTKNFTFKTGTRTFQVASYLKKQGVDTIGVRQYFQPDFETYAEVSKVTASVKLLQNRIAIAYCTKETRNMKLVAAMAADQLLNIAGVDASFVLLDKNGDVGISARSLGEINVQVILEKMGGGGHLTAAAASLENISVEFAEKELLKHIVEYLEK